MISNNMKLILVFLIFINTSAYASKEKPLLNKAIQGILSCAAEDSEKISDPIFQAISYIDLSREFYEIDNLKKGRQYEKKANSLISSDKISNIEFKAEYFSFIHNTYIKSGWRSSYRARKSAEMAGTDEIIEKLISNFDVGFNEKTYPSYAKGMLEIDQIFGFLFFDHRSTKNLVNGYTKHLERLCSESVDMCTISVSDFAKILSSFGKSNLEINGESEPAIDKAERYMNQIVSMLMNEYGKEEFLFRYLYVAGNHIDILKKQPLFNYTGVKKVFNTLESSLNSLHVNSPLLHMHYEIAINYLENHCQITNRSCHEKHSFFTKIFKLAEKQKEKLLSKSSFDWTDLKSAKKIIKLDRERIYSGIHFSLDDLGETLFIDKKEKKKLLDRIRKESYKYIIEDNNRTMYRIMIDDHMEIIDNRYYDEIDLINSVEFIIKIIKEGFNKKILLAKDRSKFLIDLYGKLLPFLGKSKDINITLESLCS